MPSVNCWIQLKREAISPSCCKRGKYKTKAYTYCAHPVSDREIMPKADLYGKPIGGEHNYHFRFTVADENELERKVNEKISEEKEITI